MSSLESSAITTWSPIANHRSSSLQRSLVKASHGQISSCFSSKYHWCWA
jgi:hypothetical protein